MIELLEILEELEALEPAEDPEIVEARVEIPRRIPYSCQKWLYRESPGSYFKCLIRDDWFPGSECEQYDWDWYLDLLCVLDEEKDFFKIVAILKENGLLKETLIEFCFKALGFTNIPFRLYYGFDT